MSDTTPLHNLSQLSCNYLWPYVGGQDFLIVGFSIYHNITDHFGKTTPHLLSPVSTS